MEPQNQPQKIIGIIIGTTIALGVLFVTIFSGQKSSDTISNVSNIPLQPPPVFPVKASKSGSKMPMAPQMPPVDMMKRYAYKDGAYSATGTYFSPGGEDRISVTLTLKKDIITDVSVTPEPGSRTSAKYQDMFIGSYKQYVVGKNIGSVNLGKISGSSLTAGGFNDALAQIKAEAKV